MLTYAYEQTKRLKVLHHFFPEERTYPRDSRYRSAIYDIENVLIFSTLKSPYVRFDKEIYFTPQDNYIHLVKTLDTFYLGTRYLVIEIPDEKGWYAAMWRNILLYGAAAFVLMMLLGVFLARIFLRPMRDSLVLLDRFIKDATHELNTPLATILTNIETIEREGLDEKTDKKITRIETAARTLSLLYHDLTHLLSKEDSQEDTRIALESIVLERIEYLRASARSKKIEIRTDLQPFHPVMSRQKFERLFDNLLSNAIKYNRRGGRIDIVLREGYLEISDTGIGIAKEKLPYIFDRYMRFSDMAGGFGIGLSIVKAIAEAYDIEIEVSSVESRGTRFKLRWRRI